MRLRRMGRMTMAATLGQAAWATRRQWRALPAERRDRLQVLLRQSAGRPSKLSAAERRSSRSSSASSASETCCAKARRGHRAVDFAGATEQRAVTNNA